MRNGKPVTVEYKTLVVIWFGLLMSQVLFLVLVYFIKPELFDFSLARPSLGDQPLVTLAFAVSAAVFFAISFVLSNQHMRRAVEDQDAGCVQTALVLGCALSEVPSLLGLILAFVFEYHYFFLWILLSVFGILLHFPRRGNLEAATYKLNKLR